MSRSFADDYKWQLQYEPAIRQILADTFGITDNDIQFTRPESADDRHYNTDIRIMLDGHLRRVSQRLRRYVVGDEFTLRYGRPTSLTEWQKVWSGFGDYFIYGRGDDSGRLDSWFVGSLDVFRDWALGYLDRGIDPPHSVKTNRDGSSTFIVFSRSNLPPEFTLNAHLKPMGAPLTAPRPCPACHDAHPVGTTCAGGWAPWTP